MPWLNLDRVLGLTSAKEKVCVSMATEADARGDVGMRWHLPGETWAPGGGGEEETEQGCCKQHLPVWPAVGSWAMEAG